MIIIQTMEGRTAPQLFWQRNEAGIDAERWIMTRNCTEQINAKCEVQARLMQDNAMNNSRLEGAAE